MSRLIRSMHSGELSSALRRSENKSMEADDESSTTQFKSATNASTSTKVLATPSKPTAAASTHRTTATVKSRAATDAGKNASSKARIRTVQRCRHCCCRRGCVRCGPSSSCSVAMTPGHCPLPTTAAFGDRSLCVWRSSNGSSLVVVDEGMSRQSRIA